MNTTMSYLNFIRAYCGKTLTCLLFFSLILTAGTIFAKGNFRPLQKQTPGNDFLSADSVLFVDDLDKQSLLIGLDKSISYWQKLPADRMVTVCGQRFSAQDVLETLSTLQTLFEESKGEPIAQKIRDNFTICQANNSEDILVTGYYQPIFHGSLTRSPPYIYPLYKEPADLMRYKETGSDATLLGRRTNEGEMVSYWSRAEIENSQILQGQELVFLADPFQVFTLHVQGSGMITLADGSTRAILFANSNGRKYRSIGKLLAREDRIPLAEISMPKIKAYLNEHVDERQRILQYNERFIFFRWGAENGTQGVFGSMGKELTPGRSVALDKSYYPTGMPAFLVSQQPVFNAKGDVADWRLLRRFVLHQDSGSAIKGPGRLDLFWGRGDEAENAAGVMKQAGQLYHLIKKLR